MNDNEALRKIIEKMKQELEEKNMKLNHKDMDLWNLKFCCKAEKERVKLRDDQAADTDILIRDLRNRLGLMEAELRASKNEKKFDSEKEKNNDLELLKAELERSKTEFIKRSKSWDKEKQELQSIIEQKNQEILDYLRQECASENSGIQIRSDTDSSGDSVIFLHSVADLSEAVELTSSTFETTDDSVQIVGGDSFNSTDGSMQNSSESQLSFSQLPTKDRVILNELSDAIDRTNPKKLVFRPIWECVKAKNVGLTHIASIGPRFRNNVVPLLKNLNIPESEKILLYCCTQQPVPKTVQKIMRRKGTFILDASSCVVEFKTNEYIFRT